MIIDKQKKYPMRFVEVDLSGKVKMETLEKVFLGELTNDRCTAKDLLEHTILGAHLYQSEWRCISIRLLRYYRAGLLKRKRKGRRFEYRLSEKGGERLLYLWTKFGRLKPKPDWESRGIIGETERELAELRHEAARILARRQIQRNKRKKIEKYLAMQTIRDKRALREISTLSLKSTTPQSKIESKKIKQS